jgi:hypothetical protein
MDRAQPLLASDSGGRGWPGHAGPGGLAPARAILPMTANGAAQIAQEHAHEGERDTGQEGAHHESGQGHLPATIARKDDADTRGVQGGEVRDEDTEAEGEDDAEAHGHGGWECRLARGRALFFLDGPLTFDAVAGEGQRLETLLRDGFPAPLAVAEIAVLELLEGGAHLLEQTPVAVAELEEEFPVV